MESEPSVIKDAIKNEVIESWNRKRSDQELGEFILRHEARLAAVGDIL